MGQKTNPNILRLGKIKEWKSRYIEKKSTELSTVLFQDLEIKKFIFQLFSKNELKVQDCRIYYSESSIHVTLSYYSSLNPPIVDKKFKTEYLNVHSNFFHSKKLTLQKNNAKKQLYIAKTYKEALSEPLRLKLLQNHYFLDRKTQRLDTINNFKICTDITKNKTLNQTRTNLFVSTIIKSLALFTKKKHNIFLNLKQINKETTLFNRVLKKHRHKLKENITELRKFQKNEFFKQGFNILNAFVMNDHSSSFLAEFIASYLKKLKRPNFFLRFLKASLDIFVVKRFSKFERVQIKIKGRFNGAPRSRHKFIKIGNNIPTMTLSAKVEYGESTAYTSNGTFGVKVWTYTKT